MKPWIANEASKVYDTADREAIDALVALGVAKQRATECLYALGGIAGLQNATLDGLIAAGLTRPMAARVIAAFRLSRCRRSSKAVGTPQAMADLVAPIIAHSDVEIFVVVSLDVRNQVLSVDKIAIGSVHSVEVHPREIYGVAIRCRAAGIVLAHNHPSGDPTPSPEDLALTKRLREAGVILGVPLIDHVVVAAGDRYRSIYEMEQRS